MKKINLWLGIASSSINFLMLISLAYLMANAVWWLLSPLSSNSYLGTTNIHQYDALVKYLNNRAPFGVVVVEKPTAAIITDNLKLTGIYLNTQQDSIAFLEVNSKPRIAKIGDEIVTGTIVSQIKDNKIVLSTNGQTQDLLLQKGSAEMNSGINIPVNAAPNNNNFIPMEKRAETPQPVDEDENELRIKRRKMIRDMLQDN